MSTSALFDITSHPACQLVPCLDTNRYQRWLDEASRMTRNPGVLRLIEDIADDLRALGPIDHEMEEIVLGALESVASAIHVEDIVAAQSAFID